MFKLKKNHLISFAAGAGFLLLLAGLIPSSSITLIEITKHPLIIFTLLRREIGGLVFYHRNYLENEKLKNESGLLKNKLNQANETNLENSRLKQLLTFKQKSPFKVIGARVIGRSADNWSASLIIDKGRDSGIKRGYVVISYLGLAGRIAEAAKNTSKVVLINDPNLGVSAISQRSRQEGLVTGTLGNSLVMKYLPVDSDIALNDEIITSGLTEMYPKGLSIGKVVKVGKEFSGLSRYAIIKPAVNLSDLEEVLIIIP